MEANEFDADSYAEILKVLGHPMRLRIVMGLMEEACNVNNITHCLALPQSTVSQHLSLLKVHGIIRGERKGNEICYYVVNDLARDIIGLIRKDSSVC